MPSSEFIFHVEDLVQQGSFDLDLTECPGLDVKSLATGTGLELIPVMSALKYNSYFRGFVVRNAPGRKELFPLLADVIRGNTYLTKIQLNDVSGDEKGFTDLSVALKENKNHSVQILDLKENPATNKGMYAMRDLLSTFPHAIRILNLAKCGMASKGIVTLIASLDENYGSSLCLEELNLSDNSFDKMGSAAFETWVSNVKLLSTLKKVKLAGSNLVIAAIPSLHALRNLVELDLSRNKIDVTEGCRVLGFVIDHSTNLEILKLSKCGLTKDSLEVIFESVVKNVCLKEIALDISENSFGDKGCIYLAQKFVKVSNIVSLNISGIMHLLLVYPSLLGCYDILDDFAKGIS